MGGMLTRLAVPAHRQSKVLYTAHGFHFYKGAPLANWALYYPIEWLMSHRTDCLITINPEDYAFAKRHFHHPDVVLVDGVGYNSDRFFPVTPEQKAALRREKGYQADERLLIYVAELNRNKNQKMLIDVLRETQNTRLLLVGADNFDGAYAAYAERAGVRDRVEFLGHREDADALLQMSDVCVASSLREGLPVNIMEAMACGLPVVAADNRGHRALVRDGENGFLVAPDDAAAMARNVTRLLEDPALYDRLRANAGESIRRYAKENVVQQMKTIYANYQR